MPAELKSYDKFLPGFKSPIREDILVLSCRSSKVIPPNHFISFKWPVARGGKLTRPSRFAQGCCNSERQVRNDITTTILGNRTKHYILCPPLAFHNFAVCVKQSELMKLTKRIDDTVFERRCDGETRDDVLDVMPGYLPVWRADTSIQNGRQIWRPNGYSIIQTFRSFANM